MSNSAKKAKTPTITIGGHRYAVRDGESMRQLYDDFRADGGFRDRFDDNRFFDDGVTDLKTIVYKNRTTAYARAMTVEASRRPSMYGPIARGYDDYYTSPYYHGSTRADTEGIVLVVNGWSEGRVHEKYGYATSRTSFLEQHPEKINLIVFTGGADINPAFYGHEPHQLTSISAHRDDEDAMVYEIARKHGIPCTGICRGGQFLVAMAGGYLYQHTTGHTKGQHKATTKDGQVFFVTSAHHQMFGFPLPDKAELLAWSTNRHSDTYETAAGPQAPPEVEPEVVWLPTIQSLAVQWHPEWMNNDYIANVFYQGLIDKYFSDTIARRKKDREAVTKAVPAKTEETSEVAKPKKSKTKTKTDAPTPKKTKKKTATTTE